jgi:NTE family protein
LLYRRRIEGFGYRLFGHKSHVATSSNSNRVGLVLGAGGTVGCAYHAGVLYSLSHHLDWDPNSAHSIVGTSAGALVGALVRKGVAPQDLVVLSVEDHQSKVPGWLQAIDVASGIKVPTLTEALTAVRTPTIGALAQSARVRSVWPAILSATRHARVDLAQTMGALDELDPTGWPTDDLRLCAVSSSTGKRRVFQQLDEAGVRLSTAVAASCSVPSLFAPVAANDDFFVDGGLHSMTNIDALPFDELDEVWVIAPMAGATFQGWKTRAMYSRMHRSIRNELRRVPQGMRVRLFQPGDESSSAMGVDLMATSRTAPTALAAFLEAGDSINANRTIVQGLLERTPHAVEMRP